MTSINVGVPVKIVLPNAQQEAFIKSLPKNAKLVYEALLARIDSRKATAREVKDLVAINRAVERSAMHGGLNKMANKAMREEARLLKTADKYDLWNFQNSVSIMLRLLGTLSEAESVSRSVLKLAEECFGLNHSETLRCVNNLALSLKKTAKVIYTTKCVGMGGAGRARGATGGSRAAGGVSPGWVVKFRKALELRSKLILLILFNSKF